MNPSPFWFRSHLGHYAITTIGRINNLDDIVDYCFRNNLIHFLEMSRGEINPTEVVSALIDQESSIKDGILYAQQTIDGSCTLLVLTDRDIYAARDRFGRTPLLWVGRKGHIAFPSNPALLQILVTIRFLRAHGRRNSVYYNRWH